MDVLKGKSDKAKEKNSKLEDSALRKVPRTQLRDQGGPVSLGLVAVWHFPPHAESR